MRLSNFPLATTPQLVSFVCISLLISACSLPTPQKRELKTAATFFVSNSQPEFTSERNHPNFSLPASRTLSTKFCIKDNAHSSPIVFHEFEVQGDGLPSQNYTTDKEGCFVHSEMIDFDVTAPAQKILLERTIFAKGSEKGLRKTEIIIDPWSKMALSVQDKKIDVPEIVRGINIKSALNPETSDRKPLTIDGLRITLKSAAIENGKRIIELDASGQVYIEGLNHEQQRILHPLTRGQFFAEYTLFYENDQNVKRTRNVIRSSNKIAINQLTEGALVLQDSFSLETGRLCSSGVVYLGLKLTPIDGPKSLRPIESVFYYGSCESRGTAWGTLASDFRQKSQTNSKLSIKSYLEEFPAESETSDDTKASAASATAEKARLLEIAPISFSNISFKALAPHERERHIQLKICLRMAWDRSPLRHQEIQTINFSGKKQIHTTNEEGCAFVDEILKSNPFANECWTKKEILISHPGSEFSQAVPLHFNAWSPSLPLMDGRYLKGDEKLQGCVKEDSKIILSGYSFDKLEILYRMDPMLNLELLKKGILRIPAKLRRASFTDASGFTEEDLPPGTYDLKLAVVDQYYNFTEQKPESDATQQEKIFYVLEKAIQIDSSSMINEEVEIGTRQLKSLGATNLLIVELHPRNGASTISPSFRASIQLTTESEAGSFQTLGIGEFQRLQKSHELYKPQKGLKDSLSERIQNFAKLNQLKLSMGQDMDLIPFRKGQSQRLNISKGFSDQDKKDLCLFWFNDLLLRPLEQKDHGALRKVGSFSLLTTECHRLAYQDIHSVFDIEKKYFLKNSQLVKAEPDLLPIRSLSISSSVSVGNSKSESTSQSWSWGLNLGLNLPEVFGLSFLSAGTGASYSVTRSFAESTSKGTDASASTAIQLTIESLIANISAPEYTECLSIRLNQNLFLEKERGFWTTNNPWTSQLHPKLSNEERLKSIQQGILICENTKSDPIEFKEKFYLINQALPQGYLIDRTSEKNRPFSLLIRGESEYLKLLSLISDPSHLSDSIQQELAPLKKSSDPKILYFLKGTKAEPGVLSRW